MPREAFFRRLHPARQRCGREAPIGAAVYEKKKNDPSALPQSRGTLLEAGKKTNGLWRGVERAHRFFYYFVANWGPWAWAPGPPQTRAQGPGPHSSELDGDRRESVCNSAVWGVKTRSAAILFDVGRV